MQSFDTTKQKISLALQTDDIKNKKTNSAKALAIHQQLGISAQIIAKYPLSSPAGISRAKIAVAEGRDVGVNGRPHKLNEDDENILVGWIDELIQQGETLHLWKVIELVCYNVLLRVLSLPLQAELLVKDYDRSEKGKRITRGWISRFVARHPHLTIMNSVIIDNVRIKALTKSNLRPFYEKYETLFNNPSYTPALIFNADETSVNFYDRFSTKIISKTSTSQKAKFTRKPDRGPSATLFFCIAADSSPLTTTLLWPQMDIPSELKPLLGKQIIIYPNNSGWQTKSSFEYIMLNVYIPEMIKRRADMKLYEKSILLLLDGHSSRYSLPVIMACIRHNITILILPAHSSSHTQPCDLGVNSAFKSSFSNLALRKLNTIPVLQQMIDGPDTPQPISTQQTTTDRRSLPQDFRCYKYNHDTSTAAGFRTLLAAILPESIQNALRWSVIEGAWKATGLYPLDKARVLEQLEEGEEVPEINSYRTPKISGRIITCIEVEKEILRWELSKQEAAERRPPTAIDKRERLDKKLKEIRSGWESVHVAVQESERARLELKIHQEEERLRWEMLQEGKIDADGYLSGKGGEQKMEGEEAIGERSRMGYERRSLLHPQLLRPLLHIQSCLLRSLLHPQLLRPLLPHLFLHNNFLPSHPPKSLFSHGVFLQLLL